MQKATIGVFRGLRRIAFGHWSHTVTALHIERDRDSGDTVELTYEVPEEKALATQPDLGGRCDLLDTVTLAKVNITPGTGGMASVKLTYSTPEEEQGDDEGSGDSGSGDSGSGSGSGSSGEDEEKLKKFKSSLDVSVVDEPILTHPKCSGISDDQLEYLKALIDGARMWEFVPQVKKNGEPLPDKDGQPVRKQLAKLIKGNDTLVRLIRQGVTSYKSMVATYTCSYESRNGKVNPEDAGRIDTPKGAPMLPNRNWMLVNQHASLNDDEKTYTIEKTWMLSAEGGWSNNIYDYTA